MQVNHFRQRLEIAASRKFNLFCFFFVFFNQMVLEKMNDFFLSCLLEIFEVCDRYRNQLVAGWYDLNSKSQLCKIWGTYFKLFCASSDPVWVRWLLKASIVVRLVVMISQVKLKTFAELASKNYLDWSYRKLLNNSVNLQRVLRHSQAMNRLEKRTNAEMISLKWCPKTGKGIGERYSQEANWLPLLVS